ncbi:MAG: nuclear transport factor 2 family protein [Hyphomicrobiaceae bacterium]|jgi:ketosteroid isomerase-like protein|nr:nuclear transport factor 2 family protein [Hyphomicrobiaceae bacterium]
MRRLAAVLSLILLASAGLFMANATDAETIAAINASSNALDEAFADRNVETIKSLMTPDHVSVTPYYDGPQSVDDQIASLAELDYGQKIVGTPSVVLLSPDVALRTFTADLKGSFRGKPLPARAFVNETLVKRDGKWIERFFQVTTLKP